MKGNRGDGDLKPDFLLFSLNKYPFLYIKMGPTEPLERKSLYCAKLTENSQSTGDI